MDLRSKIRGVIVQTHKTPYEQSEEILQLITENYQALQLHKTQVSGSFIYVSEETPPSNIELLAKSPTGQIHLCNWRPAYNIFTCQSKRESSFDWQWKLVE